VAADYEYDLISVNVEGGVAAAVITAPPMNVITSKLFQQLRDFCIRVDDDPEVRVVFFRSGDPDFFLAHFDVTAILAGLSGERPTRATGLNPFQKMCERIRASPKVTIAEIAGRVGGGGSEFCASCDMRFGARGRTFVNQMEVPLGILPGGGGTQRLPRLVGIGRALEIVLGASDLDADTAERWGYLNRALAPDQLSPFVSELACRIASFPTEAVSLAKKSILNAQTLPLFDALVQESAFFEEVGRQPSAQAAMRAFLELGGQTRQAELRIADLISDL